MNGFDKLLEHFDKGLTKKLNKILEEKKDEEDVEESDEVGAGGRQATMKDDPEDYLDGQKLVGGS